MLSDPNCRLGTLRLADKHRYSASGQKVAEEYLESVGAAKFIPQKRFESSSIDIPAGKGGCHHRHSYLQRDAKRGGWVVKLVGEPTDVPWGSKKARLAL